jgi:putative exosortase-associated protein (TIGR04073 family)
MKKGIAVLAFFTAVVFSCSAAFAATDDLLEGMGKKFFRGFVNVLTGWVELPMQTIKGFNRGLPGDEDNKLLGSGYGLLKGIGHGIGRTAWGALELFGFWTANPEDNTGMGIPLDAEYAWEEGESYDCFDPDFAEATLKPMGKKLFRGLGNGLFGFAELPGQIGKGIREGATDFGIIKGLWYWYSREVYGIGEVLTVIFPTPDDNPGYAFDEEYPWDAIAETLEE